MQLQHRSSHTADRLQACWKIETGWKTSLPFCTMSYPVRWILGIKMHHLLQPHPSAFQPTPVPLLQDARELSSLATAEAERANQELKAIQFKAVTSLNRLREDVGRLGTANDTADLRKRIAASTQKFRDLAQEFKGRAKSHPNKDGTAAQKIMRDFQVRLLLKAGGRAGDGSRGAGWTCHGWAAAAICLPGSGAQRQRCGRSSSHPMRSCQHITRYHSHTHPTPFPCTRPRRRC